MERKAQRNKTGSR